ncbi:vitamin K epoxide reductase complex subunit 1-like protein 1 isoform X1 [Apis mellifera caucasica]|uniref:vitamin-K-epoxide reductase (warfarin-sensitive) n=2 Tax=Apis mellifera TaxID=7460 RepID=A0A7M7FYQ0_APIME|nr:vitamin K epoxide reductase complex subunit 1-like protein 1 isoform X1 [Apis mellifera]KAG6798273.1 vitamin K epoxide reductase complex subunit 1-like protein 1 isoform X1 [Apis mellifera caucasica]|eukprot:XP_001120000.1 vitamin K epoxide reductase complex subunit 1-like protein 1 isoform X1 [Apis mellifera]
MSVKNYNRNLAKTMRKLNVGIITTCIVGFAVSYYAYSVEVAKENDNLYEAMCDISEHVSCTKAFFSEYGKGFGIIPKTSLLYIPNPIYGLIFYTLVAILSVSNRYVTSILVVTLGIFANIGTIFLALILYKLNNICVVCVSIYILNAILLIFAIKKHRRLFRNRQIKSN